LDLRLDPEAGRLAGTRGGGPDYGVTAFGPVVFLDQPGPVAERLAAGRLTPSE
jgi:hypothetical protein